MQCDKCNVTNTIWQMQCDKCNLTNAMWQMQCDKSNVTNAMWQIPCPKMCGLAMTNAENVSTKQFCLGRGTEYMYILWQVFMLFQMSYWHAWIFFAVYRVSISHIYILYLKFVQIIFIFVLFCHCRVKKEGREALFPYKKKIWWPEYSQRHQYPRLHHLTVMDLPWLWISRHWATLPRRCT